jgi:hypothetical protein
MRTKTILLTAALSAVTVASTMAQVYSINVVGYINIPITNGFQMIANPLDLDGTGVANNLTTVFTSFKPALTKVYAFNGGGFVNALWTGSAWTGNTNAVNANLQPGRGVFFQWPGATPTSTNVTIVGNVLQGSLTNTLSASGVYDIRSSIVPQGNTNGVSGGELQSVLGYTAASLDKVIRYNTSGQSYGAQKLWTGSAWSPAGEPAINVAESFWLQPHAASKWQRNFTVGP